MRTVLARLLSWIFTLALFLFGFRSLSGSPVDLEQRMSRYVPWVTDNMLALGVLIVASVLAGLLLSEDTRVRLLRRRHDAELRRLSNSENVREISGAEAFRWLAEESAWAWRDYAKMNFWEMVPNDAFREFEDKARRGEIRMRGLVDGSAALSKIDAGYWTKAEIDVFSTDPTVAPYGFRVVPRDYSPGPLIKYTHCVCSKLDVEQTWPKASPLLKLSATAFVISKRTWYRVKSWPAIIWRKLKELAY